MLINMKGLIILWLVSHVSGGYLNDSDQVYKDFITNHNSEVRPVEDESDSVVINIGFTLISLVEVNEIEQSVTLNGQFSFHWFDVSLQWDPAQYNEVSRIYVEQKKIWRPDIFLTNTLDVRQNLGFNDMKILVESIGMVFWTPGDIFKLSCSIDVTSFPYDTQTCEIKITTWISPTKEIYFEIDPVSISTFQFVPNGLWELTHFAYAVEPTSIDAVPSARILLNLKRRPDYYVLNILVPVMLLSAVNVLVFVLPADSGEKIGLSITILLTFVVFLTVLGTMLPISSLHTSYLTIYISTLIALSCLSLVATVVVLVIHHKSPDSPVPNFIKLLVNCIRCVVCRRTNSPTNKVSSIEHPEGQAANDHGGFKRRDRILPSVDEGSSSDLDNSVNWPDVARVLDMIFFILFTMTAIVSAIVFLIIMAGKTS